MSGRELEYVTDCLQTGWISTAGAFVQKFEEEFSKFLGVGDASSTMNGTAALHLALKLSGVTANHSVILPNVTFVASANAITYVNAEPIFIDIDEKTWQLDVNLLERFLKNECIVTSQGTLHKSTDRLIGAIMPVHVQGNLCELDKILQLAKNYNIKVIEDAAEALGATYKGKSAGTFGDFGCFSFNGNKIITTSSGGMLVSSNEDYVKKARFLATQAREPVLHYEHKELGYNYRMSNLLAAVGRGQLEVLDERVAKRNFIFNRYEKALSHVDGLNFMEEANYGKSNRWLTALTVDKEVVGISRSKIIDFLGKESIESRPVWKPMHMQPLYKRFEYCKSGRKDISGKLFENGLCLPSGSNLSEQDQNRIIDIILSLVNKK